MTGHKDFNFPAFMKCAKHFEQLGHTVFNPAQMDIDIDGIDGMGKTGSEEMPDMKKIIKRDLLAIIECDAIYMMSGWWHSVGAFAEHAIAVWLKLEIIYE